MTFTIVSELAVAITATCLVLAIWSFNHQKLPLPPGPPRWPLIGSLFSMPKNHETRQVFTRWGEQYGDVTYARVLTQDIIILNSIESAIELLERRSITYSHRPRLIMANELVGWESAVSSMNYGDTFKRTRKLLYEGLNTKAMESIWPLQEREAVKFIQRLLQAPENLIQNIRQTAGATVIKITYGYNIEDYEDYFLKLAEETMAMFALVTTPGMFLVDTFSWLKHIPWTSFKAKALVWRQLLADFREQSMEYTRKQMVSESFEPCLAAKWIECLEDEPDPLERRRNESMIKWAGVALYGGGADTTVSAISTFFIAMIYYPKVQVIAQAEIDRVIGQDRLPTYSDRSSLPYIEALYKEVLRWRPVGPIGVPHCLDPDKDDVYRGTLIPKGSMVIVNVAAMLSDPKVYHEPETFEPKRFLSRDGTLAEMDPEKLAFGSGKRRCPGVHVAHSAVWLSIVLTLSMYIVSPAMGPDGELRLPNLEYSQATISHPDPFECNITPRSSKAETLIRNTMLVE